MSDIIDNNEKTAAARTPSTLSLKRPTVEQSRVKQNFAHGRTKTVVVETKRKRIGEGGAAPTDDKPKFTVMPKVAEAPTPKPVVAAPARPGVVLRTLSADEREARTAALADSRVREAEERKRQEADAVRRSAQEAHDKIEREAAAKRKAEDDARHQMEDAGKRKADEAAKKLAPKTEAPSQIGRAHV